MSSRKKPTYRVAMQQVASTTERKRRQSDLVVMWQSFVDVTVAVLQEMSIMLLRLWQTTVLWLSASDRQRVLDWAGRLAGRPLTNFREGCRDGTAICSLLESLRPGCVPHAEDLDPGCGLANVSCALEALEKHFGVTPNLSAEDVVTCVRGSEAKIFDLLNELKKRAEQKTTDNDYKNEPGVFNHSNTPEEGRCWAEGGGLRTGFVGRVSTFTVHCPSSDTDVLIAIRGPTGSVYSERITSRSPRNKTCFEACNAFKTHHLARSLSCSDDDVGQRKDPVDMPLEYRIREDEVSIGFVPQVRGQHVISVLWHARHVSGSPFVVDVEDTAGRPGHLLKPALKAEREETSRSDGRFQREDTSKFDSEVSRKSSVRFQNLVEETDGTQSETKPIDQRGKIKNRRIVRYIVKVEGQDIVVSGNKTEVLGPALLKLDYDIGGRPPFVRRNSWGFVGDTARKRSRIRQFRLDVADIEGYSTQRRSSSLGLMDTYPQEKTINEDSFMSENEMFFKAQLKTVQEGANSNGINKAYDDDENDEMNDETFHSANEEILQEEILSQSNCKKPLGKDQDHRKLLTEDNTDKCNLQEINEVVFEKKHIPCLSENLMSHNRDISMASPFSTSENKSLDLVDSRDDIGEFPSKSFEPMDYVIAGSLKENMLNSPKFKVFDFTSSEDQRNIESLSLTRCNEKQQSVTRALRLAIRQEIFRLALILRVKKYRFHGRKKKYANISKTKIGSRELQFMRIDADKDPVVSNSKTKMRNHINSSKHSSDHLSRNFRSSPSPSLTKHEETRTFNLSPFSTEYSPEEATNVNLNYAREISCEERRRQFRSRNTKQGHLLSSSQNRIERRSLSEPDPVTTNGSSFQSSRVISTKTTRHAEGESHRTGHQSKSSSVRANKSERTLSSIEGPIPLRESAVKTHKRPSTHTSSSTTRMQGSTTDVQSMLVFWENVYKTEDERFVQKSPSSASSHRTIPEGGPNTKGWHRGVDCWLSNRQALNGPSKSSSNKIPSFLRFPVKEDRGTVSDPGHTRLADQDQYEELLDCTLSRTCSLGSFAEDSGSQNDLLSNEALAEDQYIDDEIPDCAPAYWGGGPLPALCSTPGWPHRPDQVECWPSRCTVFGIGVYYGYVAMRNRFQVLTSGAGDGNLTVSVNGTSRHAVTEVLVTYERRDTYAVTYRVGVPGYYVICVRWMDDPVPGSPFLCKVIY